MSIWAWSTPRRGDCCESGFPTIFPNITKLTERKTYIRQYFSQSRSQVVGTKETKLQDHVGIDVMTKVMQNMGE